MAVSTEERRIIYLERKERGYCPRCGKKVKGKIKTTYCETCKEYFSKYNNENSETINKRRRDRSIQRKNDRKCSRCGKYLNKGYRKILCVNCLEKQYKYNNGKDRPEKDNDNNFAENMTAAPAPASRPACRRERADGKRTLGNGYG
jgi:Zn finger protein HypA/HybF involved in hydrogenase expression